MAYLSSVTEVHELLKAANLVAHFMQHRQENENLSFADFIAMHYGDDSGHADLQEHADRLPFKPHQASVVLMNFIAVVPATTLFVITHWELEPARPVSFYRQMAASSPAISIWQPPKSA